jgi:hypothetical protein
MLNETRKVIALAALIVTTGIGAVEMTRDTAQADPRIVAGGAAGYARDRVDGVFQIVAALPAASPISLVQAGKGDLLASACSGPFQTSVMANCMNVAYDVAAHEPAVVVEAKRGASSSILMRMASITVAGF